MQPVLFQAQLSGRTLGEGNCSGHTREAFALSSNALACWRLQRPPKKKRKHMLVHGLVQVCVALCAASSARVCRHTVMHAGKDDCLWVVLIVSDGCNDGCARRRASAAPASSGGCRRRRCARFCPLAHAPRRRTPASASSTPWSRPCATCRSTAWCGIRWGRLREVQGIPNNQIAFSELIHDSVVRYQVRPLS